MDDLKITYPDFSGKCLSITTQDDSASRDLFDPHFENQGGKLFIVGTTPENATESNWVSGQISAVAWDRVTDYFIFPDMDSYQKAIKISEDHDSSKQSEASE